MKGEWLRVKDDHPTPLSLQLSAHKDATPAQRWHFLPRCAEGRRVCFFFVFLFSVRSFHSHAAVYSPRRFQERERSTHHLQQRHTQREKEGKVEHLSNFHNTCMETQTHLPARLEHSMTDLSSNGITSLNRPRSPAFCQREHHLETKTSQGTKSNRVCGNASVSLVCAANESEELNCNKLQLSVIFNKLG